MPVANLLEAACEPVETGKQVKVLWQEDESPAFVAKGRDYRSEFHINPSDQARTCKRCNEVVPKPKGWWTYDSVTGQHET
jgi:hypothetical protein